VARCVFESFGTLNLPWLLLNVNRNMIMNITKNPNANNTKYILVFISILGILFSSCRNTPNLQKAYLYKLVQTDTLHINVPDTVPDISNAKKWSYNNHYFSWLTDINGIEIYRYNFRKKCFNRFCLNHEYKDQIKFPGPYSFLSDSILLYYHPYVNELLIINLNKREIDDVYYIPSGYGITGIDRLELFIDSSFIILPANSTSPLDEYFCDKNILAMKIDKKSKSITFLGRFPQSVNHNVIPRLNIVIPDAIVHSNKMVLSYRAEKNILEYSIKVDTFASFLCEDIYHKEQEYKYNTEDIKLVMSEEFSGLYKSLLFDKKNKRYFRISLSYPKYDGVLPSFSDNKAYYKSIIKTRIVTVFVLDSKLEVIAKNQIEGVAIENCFIKNGTLYLKRRVDLEGEITFDGYSLADNKL